MSDPTTFDIHALAYATGLDPQVCRTYLSKDRLPHRSEAPGRGRRRLLSESDVIGIAWHRALVACGVASDRAVEWVFQVFDRIDRGENVWALQWTPFAEQPHYVTTDDARRPLIFAADQAMGVFAFVDLNRIANHTRARLDEFEKAGPLNCMPMAGAA